MKNDKHTLSEIKTIIIERQRMAAAIRTFFSDQGYLEVETPMLSPFLLPENTIYHFSTTATRAFSLQQSRPLALIPSPEIYMKRLLSSGLEKIFQLGRCFRNGEQTGPYHNPEFTMLEWYTTNSNYMDALNMTEALFQTLSHTYPNLKPPLQRMTVEEAFKQYTGIELSSCQSVSALLRAAQRKGLQHTISDTDAPTYTWEEVFNMIFLTHVEPNLDKDRPVALINYPKQITCPARIIADSPWRERWELYAGGIEIANCYTEETDPEVLHQFINNELTAIKKRGFAPPPVDYDFPHILGRGFPETSGAALGFDRLLMAALGKESLEGVILFPFSDIFQCEILDETVNNSSK